MLLKDWLRDAKKKIRVAAAPCPALYMDIERTLSSWTIDNITTQKDGERVDVAIHRHLSTGILTLTGVISALYSASKGGNDPEGEAATNNVADVLAELSSTLSEIVHFEE